MSEIRYLKKEGKIFVASDDIATTDNFSKPVELEPETQVSVIELGNGDLRKYPHMIGWSLPAIRRDGKTAYLFPGEQTDALDGAPYISSDEGNGQELNEADWERIKEIGIGKFVVASRNASERVDIAISQNIKHLDWFAEFPEPRLK